MDKYLYRQEMRKIKWVARHQGLKWGQKEMRMAQEMVMWRLKADQPQKKENWRSGAKPVSIKDILGIPPTLE